MDADIILTKLSIPYLRPNRVVRRRLVQRLDSLPSRALVLLSAPAGYGKSTLMAEWATRSPGSVAWVTLGASENDLIRFWQYVTASLNHAMPEVTRASLRRIALMRRPPFETPLHPLISEITAHPGQVSLFLDDFQAIHDPVIHLSVAALVRMAPPNLRVFIASRTHPSSLLAAIHGAVKTEEIRTRALAFTREESSEFFDHALQEPLVGEVKDKLLRRTDGWAAGLQIAAFGVRESTDPLSFSDQFSGQHRHLIEFFREEVLSGVLPAVREFVVKTSILDRLNADLCDAVLARRGSAAILKELAGGEVFLVPLDEEGIWYRYQGLFRDVALKHLETEYGSEAATLHDRASAWLEDHGLTEEAVEQAVRAENWDRVVALVEPMASRIVFSNQLGSLRSWVHELPQEVRSRSPYLCLWLALSSMIRDLRSDIERHLAGAEKIAAERNDRVLQGAAETVRALQLGYRGQVEEAESLAKATLEQLPDAEVLYRGVLHRTIGLAEVIEDRPLIASSWFESSHRLSLEADNPVAAAAALALAGYGLGRQGLVTQGLRKIQEAIELASSRLEYLVPQIPLAHAWLLQAAWRIDEAIGVLDTYDDLCNDTGYMIFSATGHFILAQLHWAKGDAEGLERHLEMARQQTLSCGSIHGLFGAESWVARMRLADGNWDSADVWERSERHDRTTRSTYETESLLERIRLWRAINTKDAVTADACLDSLREMGRQARRDGRAGDLADSWVAQACGEYHLGRVEAAASSLGSAISLAEPAGLLRPFFEEGPRLWPLLREMQARGLFPSFFARWEFARQTPAPSPQPSGALSEREVEILRLLALGYPNHEIAERVMLSENTVKTHLKNIYAKLGIRNRTQAVVRGRELRLVP